MKVNLQSPIPISFYTSSMHNMFGASVSEVYNITWCQFDLKIDNLMITFLLLLLGCVAT